MLMQMAVNENLLIAQRDVRTAYLYADIDRLVFVEQPTGFAETTERCEKLVCKLNISLYGPKHQAEYPYLVPLIAQVLDL